MNKYSADVILLLLFLGSCKNEGPEEHAAKDNFSEAFEQEAPDPVWKYESEMQSQVIHRFGEVSYIAKFLPALEFLARKKEKVAENDKKDLETESVILLEFSSRKQSVADVLKLKQCALDYEKAIEYLSFRIESDMHVEQEGKIFTPTGTHFEREFNLSSRKRVLCYFKNIDPKKEFKLVFHDKLLGAGILKYTFEHKEYLEKQVL